MSFLYELWVFMRAPKKYYLLPVIIVTLLPGGLIALGQSSAVALMIYTIF